MFFFVIVLGLACNIKSNVAPAPCVGYIEAEEYRQDVNDATLFLQGRSDDVIQTLMQRMDQASEALDYEGAIRYRDQIQFLRKIYEKQTIVGERGDVDVIACAAQEKTSCVQVFYIRNGRNLGNKAYFPRTPDNATTSDIINAFIPQYYSTHEIPRELLIDCELEDKELIEKVLSDQIKKLCCYYVARTWPARKASKNRADQCRN